MKPEIAVSRALPDEQALHAIAHSLAPRMACGAVLYLQGGLGAGKTSFARALLRALGAGERIKSPSYSLVEPYALQQGPGWHLDLYRVAAVDELEWLGLDMLDDPRAVVLIEWPERGRGALPGADLEVHLEHAAGGGRALELVAVSRRGTAMLRDSGL